MSATFNVDNIVVNVDFQRRDLSSIFANEVQVVPGDIAWEDLELMLKIYSGHDRVKVSYADDDNDPIVIESEEELQESFKVARKCNNTLRLMVMCENEIGARDLFDPERDPSVVSPDNSHLLEKSSGRVLYKCKAQSDGLWLTPRGANIDDRLDCDGAAEEPKTAPDERNVDSFGQKSFFIVNKRCPAMVLDVEYGGMYPGARVIVWYRKRAVEGIMNQLWYEDNRTATIRTCLNNFCLDVVDGRLVVNPCDLNSIGQKWTISGNRIQNVFNHKWLIGLKKYELSACDEVLGVTEEELTNTEWIVDDPESEFCGNAICGNLFFSNNSCSTGGGGLPSVVAVCDICDQVITGVRYKCGFCPDFDLCASCESKEGVHDPTHLLLKMRVPQDQIQLKLSALEPVLMRNANGCVVADLRHPITEISEKNPQNDEQPMPQIMNRAVEIAQTNLLSETAENPPLKPVQMKNCEEKVPFEMEKTFQAIDRRISSSKEPYDEEKDDDVVGRSMIEDLLDTKLKQLKVPSNTPLAVTPPQTPMILELDVKQSVPEGGLGLQEVPSSCEENLDLVNMAIMADLVHRKMSDIVTDGGYEYVDVERASNSSSSTSDFYVVPIPDCFNPNLPARKEASTTVIVKKSAVRGCCSLKSVDDMLSTSSYLAMEALLSPRSCFSDASVGEETRNNLPERKPDRAFFEMDEMKSSDTQRDIGASGGEDIERARVEISEGAAVPELEIWQSESVDNVDADAAAADSSEDSDLNNMMNEDESNQAQLLNEVQEQEQAQEVLSDENQVETERISDDDAACSASGVEASTLRLVSSVLSFVAKTAKDVFTTLQDKNLYIPPRSNWTPTQDQWTPTVSTWTPQPPTWSPTVTPQWNSAPMLEDASLPPTADFQSSMDQLIEMGFADRQLNQQLLQSCGNNIETVIQKLVETSGNIR